MRRLRSLEKPLRLLVSLKFSLSAPHRLLAKQAVLPANLRLLLLRARPRPNNAFSVTTASKGSRKTLMRALPLRENCQPVA